MRELYAYIGNFDKLGMFDWTDISTTERDNTRPIVELPITAGHELFGHTDALSLSNHNYIAELASAGYLPSFVQLRYHNTTVWACFADMELNETETDIIERLEEYPVLDEDGMCNIETEWTFAYWDDWAQAHDVNADAVYQAVSDLDMTIKEWNGESPYYSPEDLERLKLELGM